jgi:hypothetical protein
LSAGGIAMFGGAVDFDRLISPYASVRLGADSDTYTGTVVFPLTLNLLLGAGSHKLEIGGGAVACFQPEGHASNRFDRSAIMPVVSLGYRYQRSEGGLQFRVAVTPLVWVNNRAPMPSISVGRSF